jgi:TP901 family phage tail tape measure protein
LSQTSLNILVSATTAQAQAQLAAVNTQLKSMAAQAGISGTSMSKVGKGTAMAATGIAAVGAAAVIAGKQLYDLGQEFDDAYDTIRTGTGATGKELKRLKANFRDVAKTVPNDFKEVGTAIADLNTRMGLTGRPLERMAESLLHLSNITGDDLEGNIKSVARAFVDWEVPVKNQTRALDGLFRLSQESGASVSEIADNLQKFGSPLRTLGINIDYAAAMFATFERAGVNMQTMVPGLKLAIGNMVKPSDDLAKQFKQLGVEADKPAAGLQKIFAAIGSDSNLTRVEKISLAMDVFGKRAGADMAEAVRQGRFDVERFMRIFRDQKNGDSIRKAARDAYDFSENMKIFGNKIKVAIEPAATAVFAFAARVSKWLAGPQGTKAIKVLGQIFTTTFKAISAAIRPFVNLFRASFNAIKAVIKAAGQTWEIVSEQFQARTKTVKASIKSLIAPFKSVFSTIADVVKDKFSSAFNSAASFVNSIIGVLNKIPGVDIGEVNTGGGNGGGQSGTVPSGGRPRPVGRQRGGMLTGGAPSGDSIPALLERGEYVLNRKAVEKVGVDKLNKVNFGQAPRFQTGGRVGMIGGGIMDTITDVAGGAANAVGDVASAVLKPASFFLNLLPKPTLPQPVTGTGPWAIDKATGFIKDKVSDLFAKSSAGSSSYSGPPANMRQLGDNAWVDSHTLAVADYLSKRFGVSVSSSYRTPEHNAEVGGVPGSFHTHGSYANPGAIDFVPANSAMQAFVGSSIAGIQENLIHDVGSGLHNHVAFFQKGGLAGRILQRLQRGGSPWKKTGYTVYNDPPPGSFGGLNNGYAELGTATTSGLTGGGYLAQLFGMKGELPEDFPLNVKINGKVKKMLKRDRGWGQGSSSHGIDIWQDSWPFFGLNSNSSGTAYVQQADGKGGSKPKPKKPWLDKSGGYAPGSGGPKGQKEQGQKMTEAFKKAAAIRRKRIAAKIAGADRFPLRDDLKKNGGILARVAETIGITETNASGEWGPGGSELTDSELAEQVRLYKRQLDLQQKRKRMIVRAIKHMVGVRDYLAGMVAKASKKGSPLKWKAGAYRTALGSAKGILNETLIPGLQDLVGVTGKGGEIFQTKTRLNELGVTTTSESSRDSELLALMREQLSATQRNLAISQAQMPIFQQFLPRYHTGGVIPGAGEVPIMAQAGEGVFTRDQMAAMGTSNPQNITVIIEDGAVDSDRIRVEVDGVLAKHISSARRSSGGRKYATNG